MTFQSSFSLFFFALLTATFFFCLSDVFMQSGLSSIHICTFMQNTKRVRRRVNRHNSKQEEIILTLRMAYRETPVISVLAVAPDDQTPLAQICSMTWSFLIQRSPTTHASGASRGTDFLFSLSLTSFHSLSSSADPAPPPPSPISSRFCCFPDFLGGFHSTPMRRPKGEQAARSYPREPTPQPQYGGLGRNGQRAEINDCRRRPYLPPICPLNRTPQSSPRRARSLSPAPRSPQLPMVWQPGSRQARAFSDPYPAASARPSPTCAVASQSRSAFPPSPASQSARPLPPPPQQPQLPQQQRRTPALVSPRQYPTALPETYRVKMNLRSPQPQPQFVPATDGPKAIRNPGARTRTSAPVFLTLGLHPHYSIARVDSPSWEDLPSAPVHLARFKHPHEVYPGMEGSREPRTPRDDRPDSDHRRQLDAGKRLGFLRRFLGEKKTNENVEQ